MTDLRYPIGKLETPKIFDAALRRGLIADIATAPSLLRQAVAGLSASQLDTRYREGGWTLRQVVHHLPDSHMNGVARFKLALTEDRPTIKTFEEAQWAELHDYVATDVAVSLDLLTALHARWVVLLESLSEAQLQRTFVHPDRGLMTLDQALALYAWHGRHHTAHITSLRARMGWK